MNKQYCVSTFCIDFNYENVLLMYNNKVSSTGSYIGRLGLSSKTAIG